MNKTQKRRERAYRLLMYPLIEAYRIKAITKEEFVKQTEEVIKIVMEEKNERRKTN